MVECLAPAWRPATPLFSKANCTGWAGGWHGGILVLRFGITFSIIPPMIPDYFAIIGAALGSLGGFYYLVETAVGQVQPPPYGGMIMVIEEGRLNF